MHIVISSSLTLKAKVKSAGLKFQSHGEGLVSIVFPKTPCTYGTRDGVKTSKCSPVLVSDDNGKTWAPDVELGGEPLWAGKIGLKASPLGKEITRMGSRLKVDVSKMLEFAKSL